MYRIEASCYIDGWINIRQVAGGALTDVYAPLGSASALQDKDSCGPHFQDTQYQLFGMYV